MSSYAFQSKTVSQGRIHWQWILLKTSLHLDWPLKTLKVCLNAAHIWIYNQFITSFFFFLLPRRWWFYELPLPLSKEYKHLLKYLLTFTYTYYYLHLLPVPNIVNHLYCNILWFSWIHLKRPGPLFQTVLWIFLAKSSGCFLFLLTAQWHFSYFRYKWEISLKLYWLGPVRCCPSGTVF